MMRIIVFLQVAIGLIGSLSVIVGVLSGLIQFEVWQFSFPAVLLIGLVGLLISFLLRQN